jgi:hypothetical protein
MVINHCTIGFLWGAQRALCIHRIAVYKGLVLIAWLYHTVAWCLFHLGYFVRLEGLPGPAVQAVAYSQGTLAVWLSFMPDGRSSPGQPTGLACANPSSCLVIAY